MQKCLFERHKRASSFHFVKYYLVEGPLLGKLGELFNFNCCLKLGCYSNENCPVPTSLEWHSELEPLLLDSVDSFETSYIADSSSS